MARIAPIFLLAGMAALLLAPAPASAQPCIPCSQCTTDHCYRYCQASCPTPFPISPNNIVVSGDACASAGSAYGPTAASSACATTMRYCSGGVGSVGAPLGAIGPITLSQCSNVAMGVCQQTARVQTPCAGQLQLGYGQCSAQQFQSFYSGEVSSHCRTWAQTITGVNPGTNQWAIGSGAPIGSTGAVGSAAPLSGVGASAAKGGRRMLRGAAAAAAHQA